MEWTTADLWSMLIAAVLGGILGVTAIHLRPCNRYRLLAFVAIGAVVIILADHWLLPLFTVSGVHR